MPQPTPFTGLSIQPMVLVLVAWHTVHVFLNLVRVGWMHHVVTEHFVYVDFGHTLRFLSLDIILDVSFRERKM